MACISHYFDSISLQEEKKSPSAATDVTKSGEAACCCSIGNARFLWWQKRILTFSFFLEEGKYSVSDFSKHIVFVSLGLKR